MKAAIFRDVEKIEVIEMDIPKCPERGLLIKVAYCGICGSDLRNYRNGLKGGVMNQIMGHEISGEVIQVSDGVKNFKIGDQVALAPDISCGSCWYCKHGYVNLCESHRMLGTHLPGGYAQYMAVPEDVLQHGFIEHIPAGLDLRHAAFAETCAAVIACQQRINVSLGDTVAVIGDGPVGWIHCETAKSRGASKVFILGRGKLRYAEKFSPDYAINNTDVESAIEKVLSKTNRLGVDFVILALPDVALQAEALRIVRKRGTVVIYGGAPKNNYLSSLDSNRIHYSEITITGSFSYPSTGLADALSALANGFIHAEHYLGETVSLDHVVDGMEMMKAGKALKVLIDPWKE